MTAQINVADLLELITDAVPERVALVAGATRQTYAELDERANRVARYLAGAGVRAGDKVGIYAWNRAEWVEAFLGAFKLRAVPINLNYRYVAHELAYVLDDADVVALVFERAFASVVDEVRTGLPLLRHFMVLEDGSAAEAADAVEYEKALASVSGERLDIERSGDDLYLLYTGGTTGMPKGVMWRQEDIFYAALSSGQVPVGKPEEIVARVKPMDERMVAMVTPPIMHGAANWLLLIALLSGGTAVLYTGHSFDPREVWQLAERERCNGLTVVGDAMARPLADALAEPGARYDLSALRSVSSGGAVFSTAVQDQLRAALPGVYLMDTFGASEMGASGLSSPDGVARRFAMTDAMTVLDDDLRPVAPGSGQVGKVARRGHVPLGYYKDEAKTAATFAVDADGVRWVLPGDSAVIEADGLITVLGRGSNCINTGGEKVYPEEVEAALKSHPDVFDALVVGVPDERFTERVAAVVAARDGRTPTLADLQAHCRTLVAGYKVPRDLQLVDAVPRNPAGKPDYKKARAVFTR